MSAFSRRGARSLLTARVHAPSTPPSPSLANVDRYSTIRSFFTNPRPAPSSSRHSARGSLLLYSARVSWATPSIRVQITVRTFASQPPERGTGADAGARPHGAGPAGPDGKGDGSGQGASEPPDPGEQARPASQTYAGFYRRLALSLPHIHRPSRDDLLRATNSFWERVRVNFKWFTIRSFRPFNADDISAFITLLLMSQTVWVLVGTTTFFSVFLATANSLRLQEYIAHAISDYLTSETGITVVFETAVVPKWKDSRLSFRNVYISRRPASVQSKMASTYTDPARQPGHLAAVGYDVSNHPSYSYQNYHDAEEEEAYHDLNEEDTNFTMFDLNVDSIDVELSLPRWLQGKGLIKDAVVKGVRGVIDRTSVTWDPDNPLDPAAFRHLSQVGDFELESLQLEDVLVTVYQPGRFRPYTSSIFRADIQTFRKQWLFYDFLSAESIVGQIDNCLFSLHKPQSMGRTNENALKDGKWAKMSRLRIDGVNIDHLQQATTQQGPISWITSGKFDAVVDIKFPRDPSADEAPLGALIGELADALSTASQSFDWIPGQRELAKPPLEAPAEKEALEKLDSAQNVVIDIDLRFRDLKAAVPIWTNDVSYVQNALIRPIVAFMNANRTLVPIRCRVIKDVSEFDGSWTLWETGLTNDISHKIYEAMAYHVSQANPVFNRRIKTVGMWSLQKTVSAMLVGLRTVVDPMTVQMREVYAAATEVGAGVSLDANMRVGSW